MNIKTTWRFRIETKEYQSVIEGDRSLFRYAKRGDNTGKSKLNWEKHHLPTLGILFVEPGRKKTGNWSKKKRLLVKTHAYSSSSLTWKRPRGNRQFSHLFVGWKGPRDDKTQNTHVLNSRASLGTSGNKMADKHPPRTFPRTAGSVSQFWPCSYIQETSTIKTKDRTQCKRRKWCMEVSFQVKKL